MTDRDSTTVYVHLEAVGGGEEVIREVTRGVVVDIGERGLRRRDVYV